VVMRIFRNTFIDLGIEIPNMHELWRDARVLDWLRFWEFVYFFVMNLMKLPSLRNFYPLKNLCDNSNT